MRLDKYLLDKGLAVSRSKAVHLIKTNSVLVNGESCIKQSYNVKASDKVEVRSSFKYVSRAGYKIESIFRKYGLIVKGKAILDVGCSTGGFSDFFLKEGAAKVVGIDIASDCVDGSVLGNSLFQFHGGIDATDAKALEECLGSNRFDLISLDVSNSVLKDLLPIVSPYLTNGGLIIALFKPPYELNKRIRSLEEADGFTDEFDSWLQRGYEISHKDGSPIKGGAKNKGTMELIYVLNCK